MEIAVSGLANLGPAPPSAPPSDNNNHDMALPPIINSGPAVVTPVAAEKETTNKKKEKGGLLKRLKKFGSNRHVVTEKAGMDNSSSSRMSDVPSWVQDGSGVPPTPSFATSNKPRLPPKGGGPTTNNNTASKSFVNPSNVFVPPTLDDSPAAKMMKDTSKSNNNKSSSNNKDKPPKYIVIDTKKPSSSNLSMPDHSQATTGGATFDESYSTINHRSDSHRHLMVRRLDEDLDDQTKDEDIAYCQAASVSEPSSVSSASLQDALEWKIFGGGGAKDKDEDKKKNSRRSSLKKNSSPAAAAAATTVDVVLEQEENLATKQNCDEKEIALILANEAVEQRRKSMVSEEDGKGKKKFQSTCFNPHAAVPAAAASAHPSDEDLQDQDQDEDDTLGTLNTTGPSILSAPLAVPDSAEAAAACTPTTKETVTAESSAADQHLTDEDLNLIHKMEDMEMAVAAAAASIPNKLKQEEEDHLLAMKLEKEETEREEEDALYASRLQQEEEEEHYRRETSRRNVMQQDDSRRNVMQDDSRRNVMQDDSRATAYERQRSSRRNMMSGPGPSSSMHHDHSDPGYYPGGGSRRISGGHLAAPRTPEQSHGRRPPVTSVNVTTPSSSRRSGGPPPTSRRNWMQQQQDYSFASSPTVLEPNRNRQNHPPMSPMSRGHHSQTKDRQRQLQRMNEEGQQWFSPHHDGRDRDHHRGPPSTRRGDPRHHDHGRGVDYGHPRGHPQMHHHRGGGGPPSSSGRMSSNNSVRSDPNLFMSGGGGGAGVGDDDGYDSMMGRPRSPTSQRDLVQIYPGVYVPLRSATETEQAIAGDYYIHNQCIGCTTDVFCILDAAYVICPVCKFVSPLDDGGPHRHGLGIGFTGKTLCEMKARVRRGGVGGGTGNSVSGGSSTHSNHIISHLR